MVNKTEPIIKADCPKCKKPAKKLGLAETIHTDGQAEANWIFFCDGCNHPFDIPKLPASY